MKENLECCLSTFVFRPATMALSLSILRADERFSGRTIEDSIAVSCYAVLVKAIVPSLQKTIVLDIEEVSFRLFLHFRYIPLGSTMFSQLRVWILISEQSDLRDYKYNEDPLQVESIRPFNKSYPRSKKYNQPVLLLKSKKDSQQPTTPTNSPPSRRNHV